MTDYQKRCVEQTRSWVQGISLHNRIDNECCPDFSCCRPEMFEIRADVRQETLFKLLARYGVKQ